MTDSKPVGQGSSPWGHALSEPSLTLGSSSNRKMPVSQAGDPGAIPGGSTEKHSPVVQRQRRLVHIQAGVVRFHPGLLSIETTRPDTPSRRAARLRPGCLQVRLLFGVLAENYVLVEQLGVLATLSRWRPSVQIRPGTLDKMARYANR